MVKHYSNNIQNVIQRELFTANSSIKIAVAWFTNDLLFQPLLLKLATGVKVDLILNKDDINLSSYIDFNLFAQQGGNLYWNESNRLMHEKFCIIDDKVVITGSYNWTNKAEVNYESISVFTDEQDTIADYKARFQALSRNFVRQTPQIKPQPIVNSGKCPASLQPYTKLKFYHSIKLFESSNTPILANQYEGGPYALLDSKTFLPRTQFMFSDYYSFIPGRNYLWLKGETKWGLFDCEKLEFVVKPQFVEIGGAWRNGKIVKCNSKYGIVSNGGKQLLVCDYDDITYMENLFILRQGQKYGFYDEQCNRIIQPQYDCIELKTENVKFPYYIISNSGKYGAYILKHDGSDKLLDCKYDKITYSEPLGYSILHLQCNSNHSAYIFDSKIEVGGENCNKLTFDSKFDYKILILHYNNKQSGLYIYDDKCNLSSVYDKIIYDENFIYLEKNGKKGVYVIDHKKEFDCIYDSISFDKPFGKGVLRLQRRKISQGNASQDICNDIYVLDSKMKIGGDWCVEVEYWCRGQFYGRNHYGAIIMKTESGKNRVYVAHHKGLLEEEFDEVTSETYNTISLVAYHPYKSFRYNLEYGDLKDLTGYYKELFEGLSRISRESVIKSVWETPTEKLIRELKEKAKNK